MTGGPDPKRQEPRVQPARERTFAERDPDEPRFAGPPTASTRHAPPLPPWSTEGPVTWAPGPGADLQPATAPPDQPPPSAPTSAPPTSPPPIGPPRGFPAFGAPPGSPPPGASELEPVVGYGPGAQLPALARDGLALSRVGSAVAATGGLLAALGSLFTWATLRLTAGGSDGDGFTAQPSSIKYNGLSLLEGRVILVLGLLAIGLSVAAVPRTAHRLLPIGMAVTGGVAVVVMAFTAIGHPVELATLFRSYRQIDAVKVNLPNGVGTWLAVIGALLILAGGLLALMRSSDVQGEGRA